MDSWSHAPRASPTMKPNFSRPWRAMTEGVRFANFIIPGGCIIPSIPIVPRPVQIVVYPQSWGYPQSSSISNDRIFHEINNIHSNGYPDWWKPQNVLRGPWKRPIRSTRRNLCIRAASNSKIPVLYVFVIVGKPHETPAFYPMIENSSWQRYQSWKIQKRWVSLGETKTHQGDRPCCLV